MGVGIYLDDNKTLDCIDVTYNIRCWPPVPVYITLSKEYSNEKIEINFV